jgi:hypothetical protein
VQVPNNGRNTIALQYRLYEQQTFHTSQIVIHLVLISNTNPEPFKVPFKTQPIALGY